MLLYVVAVDAASTPSIVATLLLLLMLLVLMQYFVCMYVYACMRVCVCVCVCVVVCVCVLTSNKPNSFRGSNSISPYFPHCLSEFLDNSLTCYIPPSEKEQAPLTCGETAKGARGISILAVASKTKTPLPTFMSSTNLRMTKYNFTN